MLYVEKLKLKQGDIMASPASDPSPFDPRIMAFLEKPKAECSSQDVFMTRFKLTSLSKNINGPLSGESKMQMECLMKKAREISIEAPEGQLKSEAALCVKLASGILGLPLVADEAGSSGEDAGAGFAEEGVAIGIGEMVAAAAPAGVAAEEAGDVALVDRPYSLPIRVEAPRPFRTNRIDPDSARVQNWISKYPAEAQPVLDKLARNLTHLSQEQFEDAFAGQITQFNDHLAQEGVTRDYVVLGAQHKSNLWMAELAFPGLTHKPKDVRSTTLRYIHEEHDLSESTMSLLTAESPAEKSRILNEKIPSSKVVLFDDGVYSGAQMSSLINSIIYDTYESYHFLNSANEAGGGTRYDNLRGMIGEAVEVPELVEVPDIHVICPCLTGFGRDKLLACLQPATIAERLMASQKLEGKSGKEIDEIREVVAAEAARLSEILQQKVHLPSEEESFRIPTVAEVMEPEECALLDRMWWGGEDEGEVGAYSVGSKSHGVLYLDHKVPDMMSFLEPMEEGWVYDLDCNRLPVDDDGNMEMLSPVEVTKPPYKSDYPGFVERERALAAERAAAEVGGAVGDAEGREN